MPYLQITSVGSYGFQWFISGLSNLWDSASYVMAGIGPQPVIDGQQFFPSEIWSAVYPPPPPGYQYSTSWGTASGFSPGVTYVVYAFVQTPAEGRWFNAGVATVTTRPLNFYWSTTVSPGSPFLISAYDWNMFTDRIDQFRAYKDMYPYGFYTVSQGEPVAYWIFNQAVFGIGEMSPPIPPPNTVNSGDIIYASQFNGLINSLNSIP